MIEICLNSTEKETGNLQIIVSVEYHGLLNSGAKKVTNLWSKSIISCRVPSTRSLHMSPIYFSPPLVSKTNTNSQIQIQIQIRCHKDGPLTQIWVAAGPQPLRSFTLSSFATLSQTAKSPNFIKTTTIKGPLLINVGVKEVLYQCLVFHAQLYCDLIRNGICFQLLFDSKLLTEHCLQNGMDELRSPLPPSHLSAPHREKQMVLFMTD